jgi:hypothetical protein
LTHATFGRLSEHGEAKGLVACDEAKSRIKKDRKKVKTDFGAMFTDMVFFPTK